MLRRVTVLFSAIILMFGLTASPASAYTPDPGAMFNWPYGTQSAKYRILNHINATIKSAPAGSTMRLAMYSFNLKYIADSLVAAHRRGVNVQMLFNDNWISRPMKRMVRVLGSDRTQPSFAKICRSSCRGYGGNLHSKFYVFTKSGSANNIVMVGSSNLTSFAAFRQWNDMFTFTGKPGLVDLYSRVFAQMAVDRPVSDPTIIRTVDGITSRFMPHYNTTASTDPLMRTLGKVRCAAGGGTGINGHTAIRIAMYGWNGPRGEWLADRVARLSSHGCNVKAILSSPGRRVVTKLKRAGVQVKSPDRDSNNDGYHERFTHEKYMALSGNFAGANGRNVWTGSENWSNAGLNGDEVIARIPRAGAYRSYVANFNRIWTNVAHWL